MASERMINIKKHIVREEKELLAKRFAIKSLDYSKDFSKMSDEQLSNYILEQRSCTDDKTA